MNNRLFLNIFVDFQVFRNLVEITRDVNGAKVENHKFCVSVHYRNVDENVSALIPPPLISWVIKSHEPRSHYWITNCNRICPYFLKIPELACNWSTCSWHFERLSSTPINSWTQGNLCWYLEEIFLHPSLCKKETKIYKNPLLIWIGFGGSSRDWLG